MDFWKKKLFGIPYLYLALLFVGVLVFVAWRMKGAAPAPTESDAGTDAESPAGGDLAGADYSQFATDGTVTVQQVGQPTIVSPITVQTNDKWVREGASWLASKNLASVNEALIVLGKYVEGEPLSIDEGKLRDAWITQNGPPPENFRPGATMAAAPAAAARQGNPPVIHKVRGPNDNTFGALDALYYGRGAKGVAFLQFHNDTNAPLNGALPVGMAIKIPTYEERYWTADKTVDVAEVARRNHISPNGIMLLNGAPADYRWAKGRVIRVR